MMKKYFYFLCITILPLCGVWACSNENTESHDEFGNQGENIPTAIKKLDYGQLLAFPGAEGHGRSTTGGRGGSVYHVTTLEDNPTNPQKGSFRWALTQKGARTIVFDVAGTIKLKAQLKTTNDNLTIAGQTSPGGICIADYDFVINSNNVIIRFMRFRPGNVNLDSDGLGGMDKKNIIVDHCSISWCTDECLSVYGMENSTVQWCLAAQALRDTPSKDKPHGFGGNWGGHYASYHHNMIAHCESRVPRLGPRPTTLALTECVDIRNNVFYNWAGEGCYGGEDQHVNLVNNYYKPGPATDKASSKVQYRIAKIGIYTQEYVQKNPSFAPYAQKWGTFYIDGNVMEGNSGVTVDNWTNGVYAQQTNDDKVDNMWTRAAQVGLKLSKPLDYGTVTTHTAEVAYNKVMKYVGCCDYRDKVDNLVIKDVKNRGASYTASGNLDGYINTPNDIIELGSNSWPELSLDTKRCVIDSDGDGIPDEWEIEYGLDPNDSSDGNKKMIDVNGKYTNLEMYMNSLVHGIIQGQNAD